jgi:predicted dehydrogenase
VRILIAGLGAIGQRHARNLRAVCGDGLELLAYRRRRLSHVITEGLQRDDSRDVESALGVRAFDDLDAALDERPDVAVICTPSSQHLDIAQRAADAGCHLFIEKPVSHQLDGLDRLQHTVDAKRLVALVGCQWRFHPEVRRVREALASGSHGRPLGADFEYQEYLPDWHPYEDYRTSYAARADLGGGVVLTQIHDYDMAWWLLGAPATVTATGGHVSDLQIDVEDTVDATLEGAACPVRVRQTFAAKPPHRGFAIACERGTLAADLFAPVAGFQRNDMFLGEMRHLIDCVRGAAAPMTPLSDGIGVLRVALAVKESIRSGRRVAIT